MAVFIDGLNLLLGVVEIGLEVSALHIDMIIKMLAALYTPIDSTFMPSEITKEIGNEATCHKPAGI